MSANRIFSTDSPKAIKASKYGYLNAIHYLAPAASADGTFNLCPNASDGCIALCLGRYSGQASMVADLEHGTNATRESRKAKAIRFMRDRPRYLVDVVHAVRKLERQAQKAGKKLCVRMNGSSDIAWEHVKVFAANRWHASIMAAFPHIQFVDYTKIARRFDRALPANYSLTFSRSETNEAEAIALLERGHNVAVVFAGAKPLSWRGHIVIDGDAHDLRHLDPRAEPGCAGYVIALSPKGARAKNDVSGFVVR
jgi:hypothetical protein